MTTKAARQIFHARMGNLELLALPEYQSNDPSSERTKDVRTIRSNNDKRWALSQPGMEPGSERSHELWRNTVWAVSCFISIQIVAKDCTQPNECLTF